jgi:hypothetical protein
MILFILAPESTFSNSVTILRPKKCEGNENCPAQIAKIAHYLAAQLRNQI